MTHNKLLLTLLLFVAVIITHQVPFTANCAERPTTSACNLINPPNSSIDWFFYGNQGIWITFKNGNPLGVTLLFTHHFAGKDDTIGYELFPFQTTDEKYYSIFGNTPIRWNFTLETFSSAAAIYATARWAPY